MTKSDAHIDNAVNHEGRPTGSDFSTLAAFGLFILIGGASSIGVLLVFRELTPFWSAALRFTLAALIFWLMVIGRRIPLPRGRALLGAILFGILGVGGSFIFVYLGLTRTPAALHQTIVAIVPLLTLFFAAAHKLEKISWRGLSGGILALVGIAIAAGGHMVSGTDLSLPHVLACGLAAVCFAEASIVIKLFPHSHPYATNAIAMTIGAVMLAAASWLVGENWVLPATAITWLVLIYLAVTVALNFLLYLYILGRWTASRTAYGFVLTPFVTMVLAAIILGEALPPLFLLGAVIVLAAVYVGALRPAAETAVPVDEAQQAQDEIQYRPGVSHCS